MTETMTPRQALGMLALGLVTGLLFWLLCLVCDGLPF